MTGFSLDTSGEVYLSPETLSVGRTWPDLSPFAQGYVEAALQGPIHAPPLPDNPATWVAPPRFSDLAPATLAAMLKDCEDYTGPYIARGIPPYGGGAFWRRRQNDSLEWTVRKRFPRLAMSLGDDGLIYAEAA